MAVSARPSGKRSSRLSSLATSWRGFWWQWEETWWNYVKPNKPISFIHFLRDLSMNSSDVTWIRNSIEPFAWWNDQHESALEIVGRQTLDDDGNVWRLFLVCGIYITWFNHQLMEALKINYGIWTNELDNYYHEHCGPNYLLKKIMAKSSTHWDFMWDIMGYCSTAPTPLIRRTSPITNRYT